MKKNFGTSKFYPAYPVFITTYIDANGRAQMATGSSSYTLGNMIVIGLGASGNTAQCLQVGQRFALNFPSSDQLGLIEQAGFSSGKMVDKISEHNINLTASQTGGVPYIDTCPIVFECIVERVIPVDGYVNIIATINNRLFEEALIDADGNFNHQALDLVIFSGDANKRAYRKLDASIEYPGGHSD